MSNRSLIVAMVLSSFLGAALAIGGLALLNKDSQPLVQPAALSNTSGVSFTNYVFDSSKFVVPEGLNFVYAAKAATPAVVHIRTTYTGKNGYTQNPMEEFFKDYFGEQYRGEQPPGRGAGSGVIVSQDGYIATNNHVIEGASKIEVLLNDNRSFSGEVVGVDPDTDIALIKIDAKNLPSLNFGDSEGIQIGEWVLAIGNPYEFRSTVTAGIVSAKARNINILARGGSRTRIEAFIQTDAAVNPGNSGGALVNLNGELVGINTAIASPTGSFAGYSFAVPASLVRKVIYDLRDFGVVQRPLLGISIVDVNAQLAEERNLDILNGVFVDRVNSGSSAAEAGLKADDVIIAINDKKVSNVAELQEQVALNRPGDKIVVTYIRGGQTKTTTAILKNASNTTEVVTVASASRVELEGASIEPVSAELKEKLGLESGIQIKDIKEGKWRDAGIKEGFIVTKIDKRPIETPQDLMASLSARSGEGILLEGLYPDGNKAYYGLGW